MDLHKAFGDFIPEDTKEVEENKDVWLYTRVSSKDQFANKSLSNQHDSGQGFCLESDYIITKQFGATYESASGDFTRTEFKKLIQSVRRAKKRPFAILIYKMSRFSRTGGQAIALATELIETLGVHLVEVSSGKNTFTERGKLEIYERLLKAREENIERLEMTMPGMIKFIEEGNRLGTVPRGYDHYGPRVKDMKRFSPTQKIVINEEGKILKKAWKLKANGLRNYEIQAFLKEHGVKMTDKQISAMWRKPYYCGIIIHKLTGDKIIEGNHEPIVSKKDFLKINKKLKEQTSTYSSNKEDENLPLNKFVKSFNCGYSYSGYIVKKKGIYYYKNNRKGSKENINAKKLHDSFIVLLQEIQVRDMISNNELVLSLKDKITELLKGDSVAQAITTKRLKEVETQLKNLKRKYMVLNEITKEDYEEFKPELESEKAELLSKMKNTVFNFSNLDETLKKAVKLAKSLALLWSEGAFRTKRAVQNMVFPEGILFDFKNKVSRTNRVNVIFTLTHLISGDFTKNKKGKEDKIINFPLVVAGTGLEPMTFGL